MAPIPSTNLRKGTEYAYILPVLLNGPTGLAFDASDDLFETNYFSGTINEFTPDFALIHLRHRTESSVLA